MSTSRTEHVVDRLHELLERPEYLWSDGKSQSSQSSRRSPPRQCDIPDSQQPCPLGGVVVVAASLAPIRKNATRIANSNLVDDEADHLHVDDVDQRDRALATDATDGVF